MLYSTYSPCHFPHSFYLVYVVIYFILFYFVLRQGFLCSQGWPRSCFIDRAGLQLRGPPISAWVCCSYGPYSSFWKECSEMGFLSFSNVTGQCISSYLVRFHMFSMKNGFDWYRLSSLWTKRTYFLVDSMMSLCNRWDFIGKILRAPIPLFWPLKVHGFHNLVILVKCLFTWTDLHGHSFPGDIASTWFSFSLIAPYVLCESSPKELAVYKPRASAFSFISVTFLHCLLLVTQATLKLALEPKWLQTDTLVPLCPEWLDYRHVPPSHRQPRWDRT